MPYKAQGHLKAQKTKKQNGSNRHTNRRDTLKKGGKREKEWKVKRNDNRSERRHTVVLPVRSSEHQRAVEGRPPL